MFRFPSRYTIASLNCPCPPLIVSDRGHGLAPNSFARFALAKTLQVHAQACMVARDRRAIQLRTSFNVCPRLPLLALVEGNEYVFSSTKSDLLEPSPVLFNGPERFEQVNRAIGSPFRARCDLDLEYAPERIVDRR